MKKLFVFIALSLTIINASFPQVSINADNTPPNNSAMLDVKSTNKGFLPPRMDLTQIGLIPSPVEGLLVFNTTGKYFVYHDGTVWRKMDNTLVAFGYAVGQNRMGGIIFYIDGTGQHGFISAASDQSTGAQWGCYTLILGGTSSAIGSGQSNTTHIVNVCSEAGIASRICNDLVLGGFSDWFLPSKDELNQMYLQKTAIGGFADSYYWSSSEYNEYYAWFQLFTDGSQNLSGNYKYIPKYVRCVRTF
ncbi:MAG: DUF1566 domain-containing protein [Bacteroidetes bacterium]|nr:DUF1566 domain-containing protein [Bacteroidota bacterium]